jgi:hypothetical protein
MWNVIIPFYNHSSPVAMNKTNVKDDNVNERKEKP